jgi:hypothetical protein
MNTEVAVVTRTLLLLCAGLAGGALGQSNTPASSDRGCVKTRCVKLQDVEVSGATITYTTPGGTKFRGTLSSDRQTIVGDAGSPTWKRVRTLSQAVAEDVSNAH